MEKASVRLGISGRKMLMAISFLEEKGYKASAEGLSKLFKGIEDEETRPFLDEPFYGYWPSLSKKKIKGRLLQLTRHGFLRNAWADEENDYFLLLTDLGRSASLEARLVKKTPTTQKGLKSIVPLNEGEHK